MSKFNNNNRKVLPLKFNPLTGKYTLPFNVLDNLVIRLPNGVVDTDLKLVLVQSSKTGNLSLGVTKDEIKGLESAKDLMKIQAATRILQNAFDERTSKSTKDEMIERLASYPIEEVEEKLTEHSRITLVKMSRCLDNLEKNVEMFKDNISKDEDSTKAKSVLLKAAGVVRAHLLINFLEYAGKQNFKMNEIKGLPISLVNVLIGRIQVQRTESLSKVFYSSTKPGLVLRISELLDSDILKLLNGLSKPNYYFACYVKQVLDTADSTVKEEMLNEKVNMIPPLELSGKVKVPSFRTFKTSCPQGGIINNLSSLFRLETGDNFINEELSIKYFGLEKGKPGEKSARARLFELLKGKKGKEVDGLLPFVNDRLHGYFKDYKVKSFIDLGGEDGKEEIKLLIKLGEEPKAEIPKLLIGNEKEENYSKLKSSKVVELLLTRNKKRKVRNQRGFVRSKKMLNVLKVIRKSKMFHDLSEDLEEFLYSFRSALLQARAAEILHAELLRLKEKGGVDSKTGVVLDDYDDDDPSDEELDDSGEPLEEL